MTRAYPKLWCNGYVRSYRAEKVSGDYPKPEWAIPRSRRRRRASAVPWNSAVEVQASRTYQGLFVPLRLPDFSFHAVLRFYVRQRSLAELRLPELSERSRTRHCSLGSAPAVHQGECGCNPVRRPRSLPLLFLGEALPSSRERHPDLSDRLGAHPVQACQFRFADDGELVQTRVADSRKCASSWARKPGRQVICGIARVRHANSSLLKSDEHPRTHEHARHRREQEPPRRYRHDDASEKAVKASRPHGRKRGNARPSRSK